MTDADTPPARLRPCPVCAKPAMLAFRPFCSKRCADVDLNRWFSGAYAIPAANVEEGDEEAGRLPVRRNDEDE